MRTLILGFVALALPGLWAADIDWTVAAPTQGDADVATAGRTVFAYTASKKGSVSIRGIPFTFPSESLASGARGVEMTGMATRWEPNFFANFASYEVSWTGSVAYSDLLGAAWYRTSGSLSCPVTLSGLTSGRKYLVQFWICDNRSDHVTDTFTLGGRQYAFGGTPCGLMATGRFTADAATQSFDVTFNQNGNVNAIQLRCLDEEQVTWSVGTTAADGSVDLRGGLVYGYCGSGAIVGGTTFAQMGSLWAKPTSLGGDIDIVSPQMSVDLHDFYVSDATMASRGFVPTEGGVTNLLGGGIFADGSSQAVLRFNRLVPGKDYLVQLWFVDTRSGGTTKTARIDGTAAIFNNETTAPAGQYLVGVFRATNASKEIVVSMVSPQINAIQLRELGGWDLRQNAADDSRLSTEGTRAYAYARLPSGTETLTLANGIVFDTASANVNTWGDGNVNWTHKWLYSHTGYVDDTKKAGLESNYGTLLNGGWYCMDGTGYEQTMTLGKFEIGCDYLVQVLIDDLRDGNRSGYHATIGGKVGNYGPQSLSATEWAYGSLFTRRFTADATNLVVDITYSHSGGTDQLNALQVRKVAAPYDWVGAASGMWTPDGANWTIGGLSAAGQTLWDFENGPTNVARVVGDNVTLTLGSDLWVRALYGTGKLTVDAAGTDRQLFVTEEMSAPELVYNPAWQEKFFSKNRSGKTVLAGDAPELENVVIRAGSLRLVKATPHRLTIDVASPGALAPAETGDSPINLGSCTITGDADLTGLRFTVANAAAREGETVLTVSGTATGTPSFDCDDATFRVARKGNAWSVKKRYGLLFIFK